MRSATYQASSENKPTHHEHTKTSNNCLSIEFLSNQPSPTSPQDSLKCLKHLLGSMVAPHPLNRSERPFALRTPRTLRRTRGGGLAALGARARSCRPCAKPARAASSCMATPGRPGTLQAKSVPRISFNPHIPSYLSPVGASLAVFGSCTCPRFLSRTGWRCSRNIEVFSLGFWKTRCEQTRSTKTILVTTLREQNLCRGSPSAKNFEGTGGFFWWARLMPPIAH